MSDLNQTTIVTTRFSNPTLGIHLDSYLVDGKVFFPAKAVVKAMGYRSPSATLCQVAQIDKRLQALPTKGGFQKTLLITEAGIKHLCVKSAYAKTDGAPQNVFFRWLTETVIPKLRQTSGGTHTQAITVPVVKSNPADTYREARLLLESVQRIQINAQAILDTLRETLPAERTHLSTSDLAEKHNIHRALLNRLVGHLKVPAHGFYQQETLDDGAQGRKWLWNDTGVAAVSEYIEVNNIG